MANDLKYDILLKQISENYSDKNIPNKFISEYGVNIESIFNAAPIGISVLSDRKFIAVNEKICEMTKYGKDELLYKDARILYPDDKEFEYMGKERYAQIKLKGRGNVETKWRRKDGVIIDVLLGSAPLDPSDPMRTLACTAVDITKNKKTEAALQWELSLNAAIAGISTKLLSPDYDIKEMANMILQCGLSLTKSREGFVCAINFETGENICHADTSFWGDDKYDNLKINKILRPVFKNDGKFKPFYENNLQKSAKGNFFPELSFKIENFLHVPVNIEKKLSGHIFFANSEKNYTDKDMNAMIKIANLYALALHRMQVKKNQEHLQQHLNRMQKMESMGILAGGIAHDFNNILFPIMGYVEILMEDIPKDSPHQDYLKNIYAAANRARELVHQILTFSRQTDQVIKPIRIQTVLKEVLKLIKASFPSTIEIYHNIQDCGPVMADPVKIHQIAMNLITNAYQAMEETGGTLEVTLSEAYLTANDLIDSELNPGYYVCLTIADTGKGMEKALVERIFEPYFTTKKKGKGTGLGLAVVHGIVSAMKGIIKVFTKPGKGTVFHVYIPRMDTRDEYGKAKSDMMSIPKGNEKILIVDDEEPIVNLLSQMLKRLGYDVTPRTSSIEAVKLFDACPSRFDLVITDMTMPNLTGVQLAKQLIKKRPDIPIILCTGFSEQISEEKAKAFGISEFITKPVIGSVLAKTIRKILDNKKKL